MFNDVLLIKLRVRHPHLPPINHCFNQPPGTTRHDLWFLPALLRSSRNDILEAYNLIHSYGITHGDLELRHLRRRDTDGRVRLIDFDRAIINATSVQLSREMGEVRSKLGLLDLVGE